MCFFFLFYLLQKFNVHTTILLCSSGGTHDYCRVFFFHFTLHKSLISRQLPYYVAAVSLKWFFVTIVIFVPNDDMVVINQIEIRKYLTNFSYYESLVNLTVQRLK